MKILLYHGLLAHHTTALRVFAGGLRRHGVPFETRRYETEVPIDNCDLAVFWSHRYHRVIRRQRSRMRDYLVIESGYVGDRAQWWSLGFNGLNGRAKFVNSDVPGDRWQAFHADRLRPWRTGGTYVLVMGQVPGDCALAGVDFRAWLTATVTAAKRFGLPVAFRPHPLTPGLRVAGIDRVLTGSLDQALREARFVITYNSNSAVDALLAGVPTVTWDEGSMAWPITDHDLRGPPGKRGRTRWAERLAYAQWTQDEIRAGTAWQHLRRRYD